MGECPGRCALGLVGELDAREVEVHLRHPEVRVAGAGMTARPLSPRRRLVRDRRVAPVVERTDVVGDPGSSSAARNVCRVPLMVEGRSLERVTEHALVVALVAVRPR